MVTSTTSAAKVRIRTARVLTHPSGTKVLAKPNATMTPHYDSKLLQPSGSYSRPTLDAGGQSPRHDKALLIARSLRIFFWSACRAPKTRTRGGASSQSNGQLELYTVPKRAMTWDLRLPSLQWLDRELGSRPLGEGNAFTRSTREL